MMKVNTVLFLIINFSLLGFVDEKRAEKEKINWLSLEDAQKKAMIDSRPILIDLYTDWCYWCKVMDKRTYNNSKVSAYINENFYAVKLNAETKKDLSWNKKNYVYNPDNKVNDFALFVSKGELSFPMTVIFSGVNAMPAFIPGFIEPKYFEPIVKYYGEEKYKSQDFESYLTSFKNTW